MRARGWRCARARLERWVIFCVWVCVVPSLASRAVASSTPCPRARGEEAEMTAVRVLIECSGVDGTEVGCGRCLASALTSAYGDGFEDASAAEISSCALASFGTIADDTARARVVRKVVRWCAPEFWRSGDARGARRALARWRELGDGAAPKEVRLSDPKRTSVAYVRRPPAKRRGRQGPKR